ncbi:hypothetical protein DCAR_0309936 [Daucus carota subsp. sativus]|uniref:F-box domain-containing protein n=1 Tax=Daucus carota subsp. sativus TaxID=79200 RepID=A0AAF1ARX2_DAUCS|nr:hypothetical protein DCAR_0309936 [Daucus carota subsp. sativus]
MGDVSGMNVLLQEMIEEIVSHTSPVDVCGTLSFVSTKFRSAAKSDHVWERFLPADLISRRAKPSKLHFEYNVEDCWAKIDSDTLQAFPTKKDLYLFLSDHPLTIDDGAVYFWLDRPSGSKCFRLSPEKLSIPEPDGTSLLSPNTLYTAYLWFDFTCSNYFSGFGEEEPLETFVGIDGGCESERRIVYIPFMPSQYERRTGILRSRRPDMSVLSGPQYPIKRGEAWYELELGDYFNKDGGGDNRELKMCLSEVKTGDEKGGICLLGIAIRPKNTRYVVW